MTNSLVNPSGSFPGGVTMTSLEISELVESRHDKVRQSIERLAGRGIFTLPPLDFIQNDGMGPGRISVYRLDKKSSLIVAAQISPACVGLMVDSWGRTSESLSEIICALNSFDVPDFAAGMYVYAIREVETGRIKLGISASPEARVRQLQTGNSSRLELVAIKKAFNGLADERDAHKKANNCHIRGEWFSANAIGVFA